MKDVHDEKSVDPRPPAKDRSERFHRHKGGGISRATLARMVLDDMEDVDGDEQEE